MPKEYLDKIRQKYPQYANIGDAELASAMIKKYPQYQGVLGDMIKTPEQIGEESRQANLQTTQQEMQRPVGLAASVPEFLQKPIQTGQDAAQNYLEGRPLAGYINQLMVAPRLAGAIGALPFTAMQNSTMFPQNKYIKKGIEFLGIPGQIASSAAGAVANPVIEKLPMSQQSKDIAKEAVSESAAALPYTDVPYKAVGRGIGATLNKIAPNIEKHLYNAAGKFDVGSFEERNAVVNRGISERRAISGAYGQAEKNYKQIQSDQNAIFSKEINPQIKAMTDSGLKAKTKSIADKAANDLRQSHPDLKGPDRAMFDSRLSQMVEDFVKNEGDEITPQAMQDMKTAVHMRTTYNDKFSGLDNAFNQAVAKQMRVQLEKWSPSLAQHNKRWAELNTIKEAQKVEGLGASEKMPPGISSTPFYMGITTPVRGAALAGSRNVMRSAGTLSKTAFAIDKVKNIGKRPPVAQSVPTFNAGFAKTITDAGLRYDGMGKNGLVYFTDPLTESTLVLPINEFSPERMLQSVAESRKKFGVSE